MKDVCRTLAVLATLLSLAGCGLKGPLYFPPADKNTPAETQKTTPVIQSGSPDRNDRGDTGGPSQVN
ncbi:LPS translocon maturation chaperone LptM [Phytobacter sp. V91]|uniref:LPS translocon maturation chaperone LptM n=1 Tax=Phytobacter sp. V91 TaxID=3369425 RepID=UPI003F640C50